MMELRLRAETFNTTGSPAIIAEYSSVSGHADDDTRDFGLEKIGGQRIYFTCSIERPVRWFTICNRNQPSYITCNIFVGDLHITCRPVKEGLIFDILQQKTQGGKKIISMTGYAMNAQHPHNYDKIDVQLVVDREMSTNIFYVERVQVLMPAKETKTAPEDDLVDIVTEQQKC